MLQASLILLAEVRICLPSSRSVARRRSELVELFPVHEAKEIGAQLDGNSGCDGWVLIVGTPVGKGPGLDAEVLLRIEAGEALTGFDAPVVFLGGRRDSIRAVVESEVAGHLAALALSALPRERVDWVQPPSSSSRGVAGALGSHGPDRTQYSLQTSTEAGLLTIPPPATMYVPGKGSCHSMPQEYEMGVAPAAAAVRQPSQTPFQPRVRVETTSTAGAQAVTRFIFDL
ncbi:Rpl30 [Symbiodinium sp. CCMP2592]|nr:Rpl30 [Symbiodinium sp. CCMP2592]